MGIKSGSGAEGVLSQPDGKSERGGRAPLA
jgi:hypothetical protein